MVRDTIFRYNPDADILFWTYNWGWAPKEERLALIKNLPKDITLHVTFDMFEKFTDENGTPYTVDDYSISFEGPAQVFIDEAREAMQQGIRLYSQTNTGGRTWDSGITPYLPVPQQWQRRYEKLREAHDKYNLRGLMENHHYGWMPSFLTLFEKNAFTTNTISDGEMLRRIAIRDFGPAADKALQAWNLFSEGIRKVIPAGCDQYGPYRSGPTYPLLFDQTQSDLDMPSVGWATHGGFEIWFPEYPEVDFENPAPVLMRYRRVLQTKELFRQGCALLNEAVTECSAMPDSDVARQAAVAGFLHSTYVTCANVMRWNIAKCLLKALADGCVHACDPILMEAIGIQADNTSSKIGVLAGLMRQIADEETANTLQALRYYETDSRIGFEPTMEYVFDYEHAAWKNAETQRSLAQLEAFIQKYNI